MEFNRIQILRIQEVCHRTGLSKSNILRLVNAGDFPAAIRLTTRAVGWIEGEVENWLLGRIGASRVAA